MLNRRITIVTALLVLLGLFAYGVLNLFQLRFASGDVYPHYSSFRADPLGTRVYHDALAASGKLRVRRFIQPVEQLPSGRDTTLFVFGLPWNEMSAHEDEYKLIESFVRAGGRLVITLYPELGRPRFFNTGTGTNPPTFKNPLADDNDRPRPRVNLREKWSFGYEYVPTVRGRQFTPVTVQRVEPLPLPDAMSWHTALVLTNLDLQWRVIYARGTDPVMIERELGQGTIVIATDSYFVSNEAMRRERNPDLLTWLAGRNSRIVFNETHLGVQEQPGVATLARRYRLHGGLLALVALAALFLWKSSVSFLPRTTQPSSDAVEPGRESAAGFENLLRRSVAPKDVLQTALDEWHKSITLDRRVTPQRRERIRAIVEAFNKSENPDAVQTYREITRILNHQT